MFLSRYAGDFVQNKHDTSIERIYLPGLIESSDWYLKSELCELRLNRWPQLEWPESPYDA